LNDISLRGQFTFDSSVLGTMLDGSELGMKLTQALIVEEIAVHTSLVNIAEAQYILCRKVGEEIAASSVDDLLASHYLNIEDGPSIHRTAAGIKCQRSISLADCYTFAVAGATSTRPVFLFREEELMKEIERKPFRMEPVFIA